MTNEGDPIENIDQLVTEVYRRDNKQVPPQYVPQDHNRPTIHRLVVLSDSTPETLAQYGLTRARTPESSLATAPPPAEWRRRDMALMCLLGFSPEIGALTIVTYDTWSKNLPNLVDLFTR